MLETMQFMNLDPPLNSEKKQQIDLIEFNAKTHGSIFAGS